MPHQGSFSRLLQLFILLCILAFSACTDQKGDAAADSKLPIEDSSHGHRKKTPNNDLIEKHFSNAEKGLKGKVRVVTTYCYALLQGTNDGSRKMYQYKVDSFDESGLNLTSSINYINDKHLSGQTSVRYFNKEGNIIELNHYRYEGVDKDKRGPKYRAQQYIYSYNEKGDVIGYRSLDSAGKLVAMDLYRYDPEGRIVEVIDSVANNYNNRYTFEYRNNGSERWETDYSLGNRLIGKSTTKYNPDLSVAELLLYGADEGLQSRTVYKYSPDGHKTEEKIYGPNLRVKEIRTYEYDKNGNLAYMTIHAPDGKIDTAQSYGMDYEYDIDLNITKATTFKIINGVKKETKVDEVDIAYY